MRSDLSIPLRPFMRRSVELRSPSFSAGVEEVHPMIDKYIK